MLELLILYVLNKTDNTLYGLKKEIGTHYGEVSIPSHGALFPALKRLEKEDLITVRKKLSEGGKRYTYYTINKNPSTYFNKKFLDFSNSKTETLEKFLTWLKIRLITIDMLDNDYVNDFKEKCLLKLNNYQEQIQKKIDNEYLELTKLQKALLIQSFKEIEQYNIIIKENL